MYLWGNLINHVAACSIEQNNSRLSAACSSNIHCLHFICHLIKALSSRNSGIALIVDLLRELDPQPCNFWCFPPPTAGLRPAVITENKSVCRRFSITPGWICMLFTPSLLGLVAMVACCWVAFFSFTFFYFLLFILLFITSKYCHIFPLEEWMFLFLSWLRCWFIVIVFASSADDGLYPESHHRPGAQWDPRPVGPQQRQGQTWGERPQLLLDLRHCPQQLVGERLRSKHAQSSEESAHTLAGNTFTHPPALCSQDLHHIREHACKQHTHPDSSTFLNKCQHHRVSHFESYPDLSVLHQGTACSQHLCECVVVPACMCTWSVFVKEQAVRLQPSLFWYIDLSSCSCTQCPVK